MPYDHTNLMKAIYIFPIISDQKTKREIWRESQIQVLMIKFMITETESMMTNFFIMIMIINHDNKIETYDKITIKIHCVSYQILAVIHLGGTSQLDYCKMHI